MLFKSSIETRPKMWYPQGNNQRTRPSCLLTQSSPWTSSPAHLGLCLFPGRVANEAGKPEVFGSCLGEPLGYGASGVGRTGSARRHRSPLGRPTAAARAAQGGKRLTLWIQVRPSEDARPSESAVGTAVAWLAGPGASGGRGRKVARLPEAPLGLSRVARIGGGGSGERAKPTDPRRPSALPSQEPERRPLGKSP